MLLLALLNIKEIAIIFNITYGSAIIAGEGFRYVFCWECNFLSQLCPY